MLKKILRIIEERRVPWIIEDRCGKFFNSLHYIKKKYLNENKCKYVDITFKCGFHGKTGGLYAIAAIANMLSVKYNINFVSYPSSNYNSILCDKVNITNKLNLDSDIYIFDVSCDHETYEQIRRLGKPIVVSCHGFLYESHGLESDYVIRSLLLSDLTHFVNMVQQESFQLHHGKYAIIPNSTKRITKKTFTHNVGVVGNLDDEKKNVKESVEIFLKSNASKIHLWSCSRSQAFNSNGRIVFHSWENDKSKIYNSFDVLVFMGKQETFSLTVIEAMSAGIPCLISAIPAHEQYRKCPGVVIVDDNNRAFAHEILNELMEIKTELRDSIIKFWELHYSEEAVSRQWFDLISKVRTRLDT